MCGESNFSDSRRCQNCGVLIRRNNRGNSVSFLNNRINNNNINNNININNINRIINNEVNIDRPIYIEELEVKKMNFNFI
jgi:hypothetical protein